LQQLGLGNLITVLGFELQQEFGVRATFQEAAPLVDVELAVGLELGDGLDLGRR
jgi:hypothetical protein